MVSGIRICRATAFSTVALAATGAGQARAAPRVPAPDLAGPVHPFVGAGKATGGVTGAPGGGDAGNTFPGATLPFGMIAWSPDTEHAVMPPLNQAGSDVYADNAIRGFSPTHLSAPGCPVYGNVPFLPYVGAVKTTPGADPTAYLARFEHAKEEAAPGSYAVALSEPDVRVDLAVTTRTGLGRFTFPATAEANVLVDVGESAAGHTDKGSFDGAVEIVGER